ncbi:MAG: methionyl-tRNA formyltransferase [Acidimicrobiales bacterium]
MRLVFLGTPEAAVASLDALLGAGHDVALVVTRPDRRRGRGGELSPSPVKRAALEHHLRVTHRLADAADVGAESGVVVAYGAIIPTSLLDVLPMLNVHFSLLPRWRGAAPVQRAILAGDHETGVSIMTLEPSLDTGPVHLERRLAIGEDNAEELTRRLADLGATSLIEVLASPELLDHPVAQSGEPTYAEKITAREYQLRPDMTRVLAWRTVRLGHAYFIIDNRRIVIADAQRSDHDGVPGALVARQGQVLLGLSDGCLALSEVRPEGRATMAAQSWWGGLRPAQDQRSWS